MVGPKADAERIPGIDIALGEDDTWSIGGHEVKTLDTPGHTKGQCHDFAKMKMSLAWWSTCGSILIGLSPCAHEVRIGDQKRIFVNMRC